MNSYIETITGLTCKNLSKNIFVIAIRANAAKVLDSRNKASLGRYWSLTKGGKTFSIDFVIGIPVVKGANAICNIIDHLSKKRHHIIINKKIDAKRLADLFLHHVWKLHGLSRSIKSDCGI